MSKSNNNDQPLRKKHKGHSNNDKESFEEIMKCHEQAGWNLNDIPKWSENPIFMPTKVTCSNAHENICIFCQKFCFSTEHRGNPVRDLNWFCSKIDATFKIHTPSATHLNDLQKDLTKWLRSDELQLRMISRREVLADILDRYRGMKRTRYGSNEDCIDMLLNRFNFKSIEAWCDWKDNFDRKIRSQIEENKQTSYYCTGCGNRSMQFMSKKGEMYQKCFADKCDFFHKVGSNFARVKKD